MTSALGVRKIRADAALAEAPLLLQGFRAVSGLAQRIHAVDGGASEHHVAPAASSITAAWKSGR